MVRDQNVDQEDVSSSLARPPTRLFRSHGNSCFFFFQRAWGGGGGSHFHANIHAVLILKKAVFQMSSESGPLEIKFVIATSLSRTGYV